MIAKETVIQIVEEWMEETPFFLVDVRITPDNEIDVEFESENDEVCIDDCVDLSKYLEEKLDREKEDFALEVGSAGLGQPFKVLKQYIINIGEEVEVITKAGQKFSGILKDATESGFTVTVNRKTKIEGSKKTLSVEVDENYAYPDVKSVKYLIRFS
jgi:ribosome maturation factor RimP